MTIVVNLFAGPGAGKSTTAAYVFAMLKSRGVNCELAREYAKDVVWEGREHLLDNQAYIFAKQLKLLRDLDGRVDVIITDSPLMLAILYNRISHAEPPSFERYVQDIHARYDNFNVYVERVKPYHTAGRVQTELEARELDAAARELPIAYHLTVLGTEDGAKTIVNDVVKRLELARAR